MGIDRSNVRFVLHTAMPKSIEHYQQETGRAGRDGLEAECVLLYSGADVMTWKSMLERAATAEPIPQYVESAIRHLNDMDRYCSGATCRHRALVEYFGQQYAAENCTACDLCLGETEEVADALVVAQKILSCVVRVRASPWGVGHVVGVLRGEDTEKIRDRRHDQLSTYGLLKGHTRHDVREWVYQLDRARTSSCQTDDEYPILRLGARARKCSKAIAEVKLRQPAVRKKDPGAPRHRPRRDAPPSTTARTTATCSTRSAPGGATKPQERGVPPYVIFSDRTLRELARVRPTTLYELRGIYGIGDAKLEAFGETLITQIREHCAIAPS